MSGPVREEYNDFIRAENSKDKGGGEGGGGGKELYKGYRGRGRRRIWRT